MAFLILYLFTFTGAFVVAFQDLCRITSCHAKGGNIFCDDAAACNDGVFSDPYTSGDDGVGADPAVVFDDDGRYITFLFADRHGDVGITVVKS